jgi:hypothetical protein
VVPLGRHSAPTPNPSQSRSHIALSDESALASISQILSSFASIAQTKSSSELPTTPTHSRDPTASSTVLSPVINTPSKLRRFLEYAETHLGIPNAQLYERCLDEMGYAPDILHLVDDSSLKDIGIKPGDVIRLKQNSLQWLNSFASKRKQDDHAPFTLSTPPNKRVRFEKRFFDGGSARVYGPRIVEAEGDMPENMPFDWFYFCEARDAWVPIPPGCVPVLEHDVEL